MINPDQQALIDRYLQGKLTSEEQKEFSLLRKSTEFEEELEWQTNLQQAVRLQTREALEQKIKELNKKKLAAYHEPSVDPKPRAKSYPGEIGRQRELVIDWRGAIPVAATVALVTLIAIYFWKINVFDPLVIDHIAWAGPSKGEVQMDELNSANAIEALQTYEQRDYKQAKPLFNAIPRDEKDDKILFYNAINLLRLNQQEESPEDVEQAIQYLEQLSNGGGNYREMAEWYLALALLVKGEEDQAKALLQEIAQKPHPYAEEAQEQLKQL